MSEPLLCAGCGKNWAYIDYAGATPLLCASCLSKPKTNVEMVNMYATEIKHDIIADNYWMVIYHADTDTLCGIAVVDAEWLQLYRKLDAAGQAGMTYDIVTATRNDPDGMSDMAFYLQNVASRSHVYTI